MHTLHLRGILLLYSIQSSLTASHLSSVVFSEDDVIDALGMRHGCMPDCFLCNPEG